MRGSSSPRLWRGTPPALWGLCGCGRMGQGSSATWSLETQTTLQYAAALPLQSRPFKQAIFSQVANIFGVFTGMALYAPDEAAKVSIEVYTAGGELVRQIGTKAGRWPATLQVGIRIGARLGRTGRWLHHDSFHSASDCPAAVRGNGFYGNSVAFRGPTDCRG